MTDITTEVLVLLNERCKAISFRPEHKPSDPNEFKLLVAFRDDLQFMAVELSKSQDIFDQAVIAFRARGRFARMCHESQHGPTNIVAEEFAVTREINPEQNVPTGNFGLHFQQVLKRINPPSTPPV